MTKKIADANAFDGMDMQLGATSAELDFGFDWSGAANAQMSNDEMQQMLNQLDTSNVDLLHFSDELGIDMNMPVDLWSNTGIASVF